ncbi:hypothetical protein MYCTH_2112164 [Thermothelomyces thermophilus ATCC 42464]|uniref:Uncharacterized protein n=1 Tax=Thermothelomyces thermophilus (strain ATCC 42464 / BCRC 31852 / DSM 1799) TaxID=573729 RepID=G2QKD4_THET4|nr:uncharacterized protein MYCTH_2112164 [Thermothelomyces thermophilus ATCC 42464]AEO60040.1 hypothetical protein MYCTH_2112164 [Thermothelomyces thermophilus ATCC 42464]
MCIRIVFLCPSCRAPSGQTTTLRLHGPSCWDRVLVERLMQSQHFHPGWYCTTPDCGYSRDSQERDAKEIKQIRLNQARNDTSSDADDELYDTDDERDEAMEDCEADTDTKPANAESGGLVNLQPGPSIYYPSAKPCVKRRHNNSKGGSYPVKTEPADPTTRPLGRGLGTLHHGAKGVRRDNLGTARPRHRGSRMPVGLDSPTRDRIGKLLSRIVLHADAHPEKSKWLEEEEELLEILRAHKVSYRQIAELRVVEYIK